MKGFTWAAVTNLCKEFLPQYIRTTEELAKDKLLADRDIPEIAEQFANIGVQVVQDESFYVTQKGKRCGPDGLNTRMNAVVLFGLCIEMNTPSPHVKALP